MPDCRPLSSHRQYPPVLTKANLFEIIPDKFELVPGTEVTLKCAPNLKLQGESSLVCLRNGEWNYEYIPVCKEIERDNDSSWINSTTKLAIVYVIWGLAALVVLALLINIVAICIRKRRENKNKQKHFTYGGTYKHHGDRHFHTHQGHDGRHHNNHSGQHHHHRDQHDQDSHHYSQTVQHDGLHSHHHGEHGGHKHLTKSHGHGLNPSHGNAKSHDHSHDNHHVHAHSHNHSHDNHHNQGHSHNHSHENHPCHSHNEKNGLSYKHRHDHGHGDNNGHGHDYHMKGHKNHKGSHSHADHKEKQVHHRSIYDQVTSQNDALSAYENDVPLKDFR